MNKKKVLVVGGAGYIGSNVNKLLNQSGYDTVVLDNLSRGDRKSVVCGEFIEGDIADERILDHLFQKHKIDAVMHFAAFIDVGESVKDPGKYYKNNVVGTLVLLEAMRKHQVKNLIFSSTAAVYGIPNSETPKITEDHPCNPINPYGQSKLMIEKILADFDHAYGLKSVCLRYFNAAGADPSGEIKHDPKKPSNLIPIVIKSLKDKGRVTIFGDDYATRDGTCIRDYIHIYDLGTAHILAMEQLLNGGASKVYNLGNGKGYSVKEVIDAAQKVTGMKVNAVVGLRRPGDPPQLLADASRAIKELGWQQKYPEIETMIEHAWNAACVNVS